MPKDTDLSLSVHASVPGLERDGAVHVLPGAVVTSRAPDDALAHEYPEARVLSVSSQDRLDLRDVARFEHLEAVVMRSTGCDRLPVKGLQDRGIGVYHLDGYATESVAQHALMSLLMLLRRVPEATTRTQGRADRPPVWDRGGLQGRDLWGVTVGVLGTGRIGSRVVRLLSGLGVRVVGYDIAPNDTLREMPEFRYANSLEDLLAASEALTVHVPLTPHTRSLIDADALTRLPERAVLVNTARGSVVDQHAVLQALQSGRLAGYAADVLPGEPDPPDLERFRGSGKVVLTPHLAAYDDRALRARYEMTARVTRCVLEGRSDRLEEHLPEDHRG